MAKYNGVDWTVYYTGNSGLPSNNINAIVIDDSNHKWIGTDGSGLAKFDGNTWTVYNTSNSGLLSNRIISMAMDDSAALWIGTYIGLGKFKDTSWTSYFPRNSQLPNPRIESLHVDQFNRVLIATFGGGMATISNNQWMIYNMNTSDIPSDYICSVTSDQSGSWWLGTYGGGLACHSTQWQIFNRQNSGLLVDDVRVVRVDHVNNKWLSTPPFGVTVYQAGGVILTSHSASNETPPFRNKDFILYQNYPNPFNPETQIEIFVSPGKRFTLKIFDVQGRLITTLIENRQGQGNERVAWSGTDDDGRFLSSGIYYCALECDGLRKARKIMLTK